MWSDTSVFWNFDLFTWCCPDTNKFALLIENDALVLLYINEIQKNIKKDPGNTCNGWARNREKWPFYMNGVCVWTMDTEFLVLLSMVSKGDLVWTPNVYAIRFSFRSMANGGAWFLVFLWPVRLLMWKLWTDFLWCWCFEMYCFKCLV